MKKQNWGSFFPQKVNTAIRYFNFGATKVLHHDFKKS
uniref:Uncharacterized protein n=1 Tax=Curvibacter symbiont subsp. Hydra magnipapillata TaxID=667019 RepID=C9YFC6_CURXX|nr:hypothetical protein Csp_D32820 [Curvibacter putative symbiont of Hydra magnipapillata]